MLAIGGGGGRLTAGKAILLGAVEGITEFLPISSTGHLLVTQRLIGLGSGAGKIAADTYAIAIQFGAILIQFGAILAVVVLYWSRLCQLLQGALGRNDEGRGLLIRLLVAFAPAAVIGVTLEHPIKDHLFSRWAVIAAWVVGGVFLLLWTPRHGTATITELTIRSAAIIGFAQTLALWPGVSRSLVTIVAALAVGCNMAAALDLVKDGRVLINDYGWRTPLLRALVAFATAVVAVRWLVAYLRTRPLTIFGWYRIAIAVLAIVLLATGTI